MNNLFLENEENFKDKPHKIRKNNFLSKILSDRKYID